jgi:hypothetical protein
MPSIFTIPAPTRTPQPPIPRWPGARLGRDAAVLPVPLGGRERPIGPLQQSAGAADQAWMVIGVPTVAQFQNQSASS